MDSDEKLVMQVTIWAQEYPSLFRDLSAMKANRHRANVLARMAYFGWLLERDGVQLGTAPARAEGDDRAGQLVTLSDDRPMADWIDDLAGSGTDEPKEPADGTPGT